MVLNKKETTVAYRCPECGCAVMSMVGIFALTADMLRLKCPCGQSEMDIIYTKDKKIRLNVPCFTCPSPHTYMVSSQIFFERDLFTLPCAYSGLDMCFIGKQENVQNAMKEAEEELLEMLGDTDFATLSQSRGEKRELSDPQVFDVVMYVVHELADEGAIHCKCRDGEGDYEVDISDDHLLVYCTKCNASVTVPTDSVTAANDFLNSDRLDLQ